MTRVSGWLGSSRRRLSASRSSSSATALAGSPASPPFREAFTGDQRVRMVGAQHPHAIGQQFLVGGHSASRIPGLPAPAGEVLAGIQGFGMVGAQHPQTVRQQIAFRDRPSASGCIPEPLIETGWRHGEHLAVVAGKRLAGRHARACVPRSAPPPVERPRRRSHLDPWPARSSRGIRAASRGPPCPSRPCRTASSCARA